MQTPCGSQHGSNYSCYSKSKIKYKKKKKRKKKKQTNSKDVTNDNINKGINY